VSRRICGLPAGRRASRPICHDRSTTPSVQAQPLDGAGLAMSPLKVSADQTAVAQCGRQALVSKQSSHFIQPCTAAQPAGCGEMPQSMGTQPAVLKQAGLRAQAMEDLDQVPRLEWSHSPIHKYEGLRGGCRVAREPGLQSPRGGRSDEGYSILAALARPHE